LTGSGDNLNCKPVITRVIGPAAVRKPTVVKGIFNWLVFRSDFKNMGSLKIKAA